MKTVIYVLFPFLLFVAGCGNDESNSQETNVQMNSNNSNMHSGTVVDKINAGSYSYLQLEENDKTYWIAVPQMPVEQGETVYFSQYMEMKNFKSESLDKTFASVLFVSDARKTLKKVDLLSVHPQTKSLDRESISVEKIEQGKTVSQIFSEKESLRGKIIIVKGKVVKFNSEILNRNWIHIQDGTADGNNFDLLITSTESVEVGDIIIAEGQLVIDKDFGAGYSYPLLIENAKILKD